MCYTPYFYIIQDVRTKKYYGGSSYSVVKVAHPSQLLTTYFTSSVFVQNLISERPDDFIIRKIKSFQTEEEAKYYETRFLTKVKAMTNVFWYNKNEGFAPPSGRNRKHYNNGVISIFIPDTESPPDGFVFGRLKYSYPKNRKKKSKEDCLKNNKNRGKICYTNGEKNIYLFEDEDIPVGFSKGTRTTSNSKTLLKQKRSWYTDGTENISLKEGEKVPFGYYKGKIQGKR